MIYLSLCNKVVANSQCIDITKRYILYSSVIWCLIPTVQDARADLRYIHTLEACQTLIASLIGAMAVELSRGGVGQLLLVRITIESQSQPLVSLMFYYSFEVTQKRIKMSVTDGKRHRLLETGSLSNRLL